MNVYRLFLMSFLSAFLLASQVGYAAVKKSSIFRVLVYNQTHHKLFLRRRICSSSKIHCETIPIIAGTPWGFSMTNRIGWTIFIKDDHDKMLCQSDLDIISDGLNIHMQYADINKCSRLSGFFSDRTYLPTSYKGGHPVYNIKMHLMYK